jgi:hypothetical protein
MEFDKVMSITWDIRAVTSIKRAFRIAADNPLRSVLMGLVCHLINVQGTPLSDVNAIIRPDVVASA